MAKLKIVPQDQIQKINRFIREMEAVRELPEEVLRWQPEPGAWSILQIVEHLTLAYADYAPKFEQALNDLPDLEEPQDVFWIGGLTKWFIEGQRPKGEKRRMKMKTFKRMDPVQVEGEKKLEDKDAVFEAFFESQEAFKAVVEKARLKKVKQFKIDSAVGRWVRFYLPEAFEFLLSHQERHWVQLEGVLSKKGEKLPSP